MKQMLIRVDLLTLIFMMLFMCVIACSKPDIVDHPGTGDVSDVANSTGENNSDETNDNKGERGEVPMITFGENTIVITADELLAKIRSGSLMPTDDYAVTEGEPVLFGNSTDRGKTYDLNGATLRLAVRSGEYGIDLGSAREMTIKGGTIIAYGGMGIGSKTARNCTLSGVSVTGACDAGISIGGKNNTVKDCKVTTETEAGIENGIVATGENITVINCEVVGAKQGITDNSTNGAVAEENTVKNCQIGITTNVPNSVIWYNTVTGGTVGIEAAFEKSEISAAMSAGYNVMAAKNEISGSEISIHFKNVSNGVVLLNSAENINVEGCTNAYVVKNQISDRLTLTDNNYLIANENDYSRVSRSGNKNVNGDNLTDLSKRSESGVNEDLLPHINVEQFVGMERKSYVRSTLGEKSIKDYIEQYAKQGKSEIIIPPGAYGYTGIVLEGANDITIYGYGVLAELGSAGHSNAFSFTNCKRCTVNGIFISASVYAHTQGTILSSGGGTVKFVADPGYRENFADSGYFSTTAPAFHYTDGRMYPNRDFTYTSKTYDLNSNVNTLSGVRNTTSIKSGDRISLRADRNSSGLSFYTCSEMIANDVTVFSVAHFAERDSDCDIAPVLNRFAVKAGPAPILTGTESDYAGFEDILWRDSYGRLRSAEPLLTSCDATHSINERTGIQIINSLFERLGDDAGNINGTYGLVASFDSSTMTLTYQPGNVNGYHELPAAFRTGDGIALYTYASQQVYVGKTVSATVDNGDGTYSVKLDGTFTMPDGDVVVQNLSGSGSGFLIDNVLVSEVGCNGFRIKAPNGVIKNSTFQKVSKGCINCIPEYQGWPECGFITEGLKIQNNIFDTTGLNNTNQSLENGDFLADTVVCTAILIRSKLLGQEPGEPDFQSDKSYLMHRNIEISGNVFTNRWGRYSICMGSVDGVTITGNRFGDSLKDAYDNRSPIILLGGNNVQLKGNEYASGVSNAYEIYEKGSVTNITCTDNP